MEEEIKKIISWIKEQLHNSNSNGIIIAVSGGIDSAVASSLAKQATNNTIGIWIDIESSNKFKENAKKHLTDNNIKMIDLNLTDNYKQLLKDLKLEDAPLKVKGNLKSRLRMLTAYSYANYYNYLVLASTNEIEYYLGYYTKWGDGAADIFPLIKYKKSEMKEMANLLKIDKEIINATPSADLYAGQSDEKEMGISYAEIEKFLNNKEISKEKKELIQNYHRNSRHKRDITFFDRKI